MPKNVKNNTRKRPRVDEAERAPQNRQTAENYQRPPSTAPVLARHFPQNNEPIGSIVAPVTQTVDHQSSGRGLLRTGHDFSGQDNWGNPPAVVAAQDGDRSGLPRKPPESGAGAKWGSYLQEDDW